jgi:hypothetical protein
LPSDDSVIFKHSKFFRDNPNQSLPSSEEVRAEACRRKLDALDVHTRPLPVHYPAIGLTVKYGNRVHIAGGQCLWAIRDLLSDLVPVPEVYSWAIEGNTAFIYGIHPRGDVRGKMGPSLGAREENYLQPTTLDG